MGSESSFNLKEYFSTDGLITNKKDLILSTTNADCILLLFFDPVKKVIANTHSGWKGTLKRISVKTVKKMKEEYGCNASDIICCICPSIRKCHFEVEKDVKDLFEKINLFVGETQIGLKTIQLTYGLGMAIGITAFYNHFGKKKKTYKEEEIYDNLYEKVKIEPDSD